MARAVWKISHGGLAALESSTFTFSFELKVDPSTLSTLQTRS